MTEYIIRWDGIAKQLAELKNSTPMYLWSKRIRAERLREPIVRCKDCRFYEKGDSGWWCKKSITLVPDPNGFCAWGERKVVD